jgi:hypothetical protein
MDKIKIKLLKSEKKLIEIPNNYKFHLIDYETYEPLTVQVKCKDFFQDIFWSEKTKEDVKDIYGFFWKCGTYDFHNKPKLMFAITKLNDYGFGKKHKNIQELLNIFDKSLNFEPSIVKPDETEKYCVVLVDSKWIKRPYLSSLLFFITRLGEYYEGSNILEFLKEISNNNSILNDAIYLRNSLTKIKNILKGYEYNQNWEDYQSFSNTYYIIHNSSGIVNLDTKKYKLIKNKKIKKLQTQN